MAMMHPRSIYPVLATCTHSSASPSTSSAVARLGALSLTRHISSSPVSAASARPIDPSMSAGYLGHPVRPFSAPRGPGGFGKTGGKTRDRARMTEEDAKREFQSWCQTTGSEFKWPKPYVRNWLGGTRPYPANPYFKPTPPLSCDLQDEVYKLYKTFPEEVEALERINLLSEKYTISKDRITAIIKTGQVADAWAKAGQPPQLPFARGMEAFLCVPKHDAPTSHEDRPSSTAALAFPQYLGSRIDLERDQETEKLATGERVHRFEDSGFDPATTRSVGLMSWEMTKEGEQPLTSKIALEKPLRPPPTLPVYPNKVVRDGKQPVWNFVDVGGKFEGLGWDGAFQRKGREAPSPLKPMRQFMPLVATRSGPVEKNARSRVLAEKKQARLAKRAELNAKGELTPHQAIVAKMTPPSGRRPIHLINEDIMNAKREHRVRMSTVKHNRRIRLKEENKKEFERMVKAKIEGLD